MVTGDAGLLGMLFPPHISFETEVAECLDCIPQTINYIH